VYAARHVDDVFVEGPGFVVWCLVFGVWCLVFGVVRFVFCVLCSVLGV